MTLGESVPGLATASMAANGSPPFCLASISACPMRPNSRSLLTEKRLRTCRIDAARYRARRPDRGRIHAGRSDCPRTHGGHRRSPPAPGVFAHGLNRSASRRDGPPGPKAVPALERLRHLRRLFLAHPASQNPAPAKEQKEKPAWRYRRARGTNRSAFSSASRRSCRY